MSDNISIKEVDDLIRNCNRCRKLLSDDEEKRCKTCKTNDKFHTQKKQNERKLFRNECYWILENDKKCTYEIEGIYYCKRHSIYENVFHPDDLDSLFRCPTCRNLFKHDGAINSQTKKLYKTCLGCRFESGKKRDKNREEQLENRIFCIMCNKFEALENGTCKQCQTAFWAKEVKENGNKPCSNYIRGCRVELDIDDEYNNCETCRKNCRKSGLSEHKKEYTQIKNAIQRNVEVKISNTEINKLINSECYYCGIFVIDNKYNGIDRKDNSDGYTNENSISCCGDCNYLKHKYDDKTFLNRCFHIIKYLQLFDFKYELNYKLFNSPSNVSYNEYKKGAINRNYEFKISKEEFDITFNSCHYCGKEPNKRNGIDRLNNDIGYLKNNIVSCCSTCNLMKQDSSAEDFIDHLVKITRNFFDEKYKKINGLRNELYQKLNDIFKYKIRNEVSLYKTEYYKDKLYVGKLENLDIEYEDVKTIDQIDMYNFICANIGNIYNDIPNNKDLKPKYTQILIKDINTNKYIGIFCFELDNELFKVKHLIPISNNIEDLLIGLCFSNEIQKLLENKYNTHMAIMKFYTWNEDIFKNFSNIKYEKEEQKEVVLLTDEIYNIGYKLLKEKFNIETDDIYLNYWEMLLDEIPFYKNIFLDKTITYDIYYGLNMECLNNNDIIFKWLENKDIFIKYNIIEHTTRNIIQKHIALDNSKNEIINIDKEEHKKNIMDLNSKKSVEVKSKITTEKGTKISKSKSNQQKIADLDLNKKILLRNFNNTSNILLVEELKNHPLLVNRAHRGKREKIANVRNEFQNYILQYKHLPIKDIQVKLKEIYMFDFPESVIRSII